MLSTKVHNYFNSCVHDGTLWMATVTFPSDRTSRLLKEKSIKYKEMHTLNTVQLKLLGLLFTVCLQPCTVFDFDCDPLK